MKRIVAGLLTLALLVGGWRLRAGAGAGGDADRHRAGRGKADCILIQESAGGAMLIDTGTRESASAILEFLRARGIDTLETLLLTHMDKDHIGGAAAILQAVKAERVVQPGASQGQRRIHGLSGGAGGKRASSPKCCGRRSGRFGRRGRHPDPGAGAEL